MTKVTTCSRLMPDSGFRTRRSGAVSSWRNCAYGTVSARAIQLPALPRRSRRFISQVGPPAFSCLEMILMGAASTTLFPSYRRPTVRSEEHTSELQSLMRISYAVFCLKKKNNTNTKYKIPKSIQTTQNNNNHLEYRLQTHHQRQ